MAIALISTNKNFLKLKEHIHDLDPNIEVDIWPRITSKKAVRMSVCWNIPQHTLTSYPNLQLISRMELVFLSCSKIPVFLQHSDCTNESEILGQRYARICRMGAYGYTA